MGPTDLRWRVPTCWNTCSLSCTSAGEEDFQQVANGTAVMRHSGWKWSTTSRMDVFDRWLMPTFIVLRDGHWPSGGSQERKARRCAGLLGEKAGR